MRNPLLRFQFSLLLCLVLSTCANARVETVRFQSKLINAARINSLPYFYFDCGTEDSPLIFPFNRELAGLMFEKKIPHEFRQMPGDHSWAYWDRQVREILKIAAQKMRLPSARTRTSRA